MKVPIKKLALGVVLVITTVALLAADKKDSGPKQVFLPRFLVLESTPGEVVNGLQPHVLKVSPHYGKIDGKSLKYRLETETQEITIIVMTEKGYAIRRGDIIGFNGFDHLKLEPGSSIIRHLKSGGHESVP